MYTVRSLHRFALASALVLAMALAGCMRYSDEVELKDGGAGTGGTDGFSLPDATPACTPACAPPQYCSRAGTCLDEGRCSDHADCPGTGVCNPFTGTCVSEDQCGSMQLDVDTVPPNLLVSLDRSCSMNTPVKNSHWSIAVAALKRMLKGYTGRIRFGLALFPDTEGEMCEQGAVTIAVAAGNEVKITDVLTSALKVSDPNFPKSPCSTNIDTAMQQARDHAPLYDTSRENYVMLITDGSQAMCSSAGGDAGTTQLIKEMASKKIKTFVLGFGKGVDPTQLDLFAEAGGVPASGGSHKFYEADDQQSLDKALDGIASTTLLGCVFKLTDVPPSMDKVYVFFDKQEVKRDTTHTDGWDYDSTANKATFYGPACDKLKKGEVLELEFVYGCKKPPTCQAGVQPCWESNDCPAGSTCSNRCCIKIVE